MHSNQYSQALFAKSFFQFSLWTLWIGSGAFAEAKGAPYTQMFKKANLKRGAPLTAPLTAPFKAKAKTKSFLKNEIIQNNYLINILKNIINQNNTLINLLKNKVDREEGVGLQGDKSPVKVAKPDQADTKSHQALEKFLWSGDVKANALVKNTNTSEEWLVERGASLAIFQDNLVIAEQLSETLKGTIKGSNDQDFAGFFRVPYLDQHQAEEVLKSSIALPKGPYEISFF